jgi:hypothetical protein
MNRTEAHQCCGTEAPVYALAHAERFVVWASRVWIEAHGSGRFPCRRLQAMFQHLGLQDCIGPFYSLFTFLAHEASHDLDFRCPACKLLGDDERRLLTLLAAYQQGTVRAAEIVLEDWLPKAMAERAAYPARLIANTLAENGLLLRGVAGPRNLADMPVHAMAH